MAKRCPVCDGSKTNCWACGGTGEVDPGAVRRAIEERIESMLLQNAPAYVRRGLRAWRKHHGKG